MRCEFIFLRTVHFTILFVKYFNSVYTFHIIVRLLHYMRPIKCLYELIFIYAKIAYFLYIFKGLPILIKITTTKSKYWMIH